MIQWRIADTKEYHIKKSNIERNILYWRVIANVRNTYTIGLADTQEYTSL